MVTGENRVAVQRVVHAIADKKKAELKMTRYLRLDSEEPQETVRAFGSWCRRPRQTISPEKK
jgi:hypothetical protein